MEKKFFESAEKARTLLQSIPAEYAEVRLSSSIANMISLSGEEVETFSSGHTVAGSVRVLINGTWGFISFNDISDIDRLIERVLSRASEIEVPLKSGVVHAPAMQKSYSTQIVQDFNTISADEKFELIQGYNEILKSSEYIETTRSLYRDVRTNYRYLNSEGSDLSWDRAYCGVSFTSIAKDGAVIQPFHDSVSGYGGFEIVEAQEERAARVVKTAVDMLKAESAPGGTAPVVADQRLAGVFIHEAFGHLSEADFVHENERLRGIMQLGREFGPHELNVIDDGSMPGLAGYIPFDDEGVLPQKAYLIKDGKLSGRLHSRETAYKMKEYLTGNARAIGVMRQPIVRMTNTSIMNGTRTQEEMLERAEGGIYALNVVGGQTNLEMFTFTAAYGYEIKNGKPGKMFKNIVLSGNVFKTLANIVMIGNDLKMFGGLGGCGKEGQIPLPVSYGGPHILIQDVLIGGKE